MKQQTRIGSARALFLDLAVLEDQERICDLFLTEAWAEAVARLEEFTRRVDQVLADELNCNSVGQELVPAIDRIGEVLDLRVDWDQSYIDLTKDAS